jgi:hypothetical protein
MTVVCLKGCEREWPRDPILEVGCPVCHAPVGAKCRNPSGWTKWGDNAFHAERDIAADRAGARSYEPFRPTVTTTHLTPPHVLAALGGADSFDLDPCAAPLPRPWPTARRMISLPDNGLMVRWSGRVFLNPPYTGNEIGRWLARMAEHGQGTALINATTETEAFQRFVWERASGLLFLEGRLIFCDANGQPLRGKDGRAAEQPVALGPLRLRPGRSRPPRRRDLDGAFVPLRFARFALVAGLDQHGRRRSATGCAPARPGQPRRCLPLFRPPPQGPRQPQLASQGAPEAARGRRARRPRHLRAAQLALI